MASSRILRLIAAVMMLLAFGGGAWASTYQFNVLSAHNLNMNWADATRWTLLSGSGTYPNGQGDVAQWPSNAAFDHGFHFYQPTTLGNLTFYGSRLDLYNDGNSLTFDNAGAGSTFFVKGTYDMQFYLPIVLNDQLHFISQCGQRIPHFDGAISGAGGLWVTASAGTNRVNLNAANSYQGGTTLDSGMLYLAAASTLGQNIAGNNVSVTASATVPTNLVLSAAGNVVGNQTITLTSTAASMAGIGVGYNAVPAFVNNTGTFGGVLGINTTTFTAVTNLGNLFGGGAGSTDKWYLGSQVGGTFTGTTLAPASDGVYRLGGGTGTLQIANANVVTGANALVVGSTLVNGTGGVQFNAPQDFSGAVTVNTGSTLTFNYASAYTHANTITGGGALAKSGAGTLTLSGAGNSVNGLDITAGKVELSAGASLTTNSTGDDSLRIRGSGATFAMTGGTLNLKGRLRLGNDGTLGIATFTGGTVNHTGNNIDLGFNQGRALFTVAGTAVYNGSGRTLEMSNANYCNSLAVFGDSGAATFGAINMGTTNGGANQYSMINLSGSASVTGTSLTVGVSQNQNNGNVALATVNQTGGTMTVNGIVRLASNNILAGTPTTALQGTYNLAGGRVVANQVLGGGSGIGGQARLNFHGGTLAVNPAATGAQTGNFISLNANSTDGAAYVYEGGSIDTGSLNATISQPLLAPTGQGLSAIGLTAGGTGYFIPPAVKITGGGGTGASASANINPATGAITGFTITNPGTGYTSAPTIALDRGSGSSATAGAASLAANAFTGGITKLGSGTLILNAVNTYTGATTVQAGTVKLGVLDAISAGGFVLPAAGTLDLNSLSHTIAGTASFQGGTLLNATTLTKNSGDYDAQSGSYTVNLGGSAGLVKSTAGVFSLVGNQSYTGATQVSAGTLAVGGTLATSGLSLGNNARLSAVGSNAVMNALTLGAAGADVLTLDAVVGSSIFNVTAANSLTNNGATTINIGGTLVTGQQYPLIDYAGTLQGGGTFALALTGRSTGHIVTNVGNSSIDIFVDGVDNPKWTGAVDANWDTTTQNWKLINNGTPTTYIQNTDSVLFDDSATGTTSVNLTGAMSPLTTTVNNPTKAYAFGGPGRLTGVTGLLKQGGGTLTISTSGNDYTGGTTLSGGTVQSGLANALPTSGDLTLSGGTLDLGGFAQTDNGAILLQSGAILNGTLTKTGGVLVAESGTVSAVLAGTMGLTKNTAGTLTLGGASTYSGQTTLNAGRLNIDNGGLAGASAIGTAALAINGGTIGNTSGGPVSLATNNVQTWAGDFTFAGPSDLNLGSGAVTMTAARQVTVDAGALTVGGAISGAAMGLTKAGPGTLVLAGSNTFSGETRIAAGTLQLGAALALQNSTLNLDAADAGTLSLGSLTAATLGGLKGARGLSIPSSFTLTIGNNGQPASYDGVLSGTTGSALTKIGAGTQTLTGAGNSLYSLTLDGGTLALAGGTTSVTWASDDCFKIRNSATLSMSAGTLNISGRWRFGQDGNVGVANITGGTINHTGYYVDMGYNSGRGLLNLGGTAVYNGAGRTLEMSNAWVGNTFVNVSGNAAATFGGINMCTSNGAGVGQYATISIADNAAVTASSMRIGVSQSSNTLPVATVEQTGGTMTVNGTVTLMQTAANPASSLGSYNLGGGVLAAQRIVGGTGTARLNFHGGTLRYNGTSPQTDFINLGADGAAYIYEGATIDPGSYNVTIAQPLLAPTGQGLSAVGLTAGGTGYVVPPAVKITGGDGTGATAMANVNPATGVVTGITVTNPGTGYTSAPTVAFDRGSGSSATVGTGSVSPNAYTGGLTKTGSGVLTLTAANTYTGPTVIQTGTLALSGAGALASSVIDIRGGAQFDVSGVSNGFTLAGGQTLMGNGEVLGATTTADASLVSPGAGIGRLMFNQSLILGGTLLIEVDPAGNGLADVLDARGTLDIRGATLDLDILGDLDDEPYIFANYGQLNGAAFAEILDLPKGYEIDYNYLQDNQIALVREQADDAIPEPATMALLGLAVAGIGGYLRKRTGIGLGLSRSPSSRKEQVMRTLVLLCAAFAMMCSNVLGVEGPAHRYSFNDATANDSAGTLHGTAMSDVTFSGGQAVFNGGGNSYITFGGNDIATLATAHNAVTIEAWITLPYSTDWSWARVYDFGQGVPEDGPDGYMFWNVGNNTDSNTIIKPTGRGERGVWGNPGLQTGTTLHIAAVYDGATSTVTRYLGAGGPVQSWSGGMDSDSLFSVSSSKGYIGRSMYWDPLLTGSVDEFRIWNRALDSAQFTLNDANGVNAPFDPLLVYGLKSNQAASWTVPAMWDPDPTAPLTGIPDAATNVTITHAVTLGANGDALTLKITGGGSLAVTGSALSVGATMNTVGGTLSLDAASTLSAGIVDTATSLAGLSAAAGASVNVSGALTVNSVPTALAGVKLVTKAITVNSGVTFDAAALNSFQLTGGAVQVTDNGTFNLNQGTNTASTMSLTNGGALNVVGTALVRPSLAVSGQIDVVSWGNLSTLVVDTADVSCNEIRITHDEGARGKMIVRGNGTFTANYVQQGYNGAMSGLQIQDSAVMTVNGNMDVNQAHNGNTQNSVSGSGKLAIGGNFVLGSDNGVNGWGSPNGSTQYANLLVSGTGTVSVNGNMTMSGWCNGGTYGGMHSQVYQTGGTVEVKDGNGLTMSRDYVSGSMDASYNLQGGVFKTQKIVGGGGGAGGLANFNFHGGTLAYNGTAAQTDFINIPTGGVYLYEGATIDTGSQNVTINQPLLAPTGSGLQAGQVVFPTPQGTGYWVEPMVKLTGGGGSGATGIAHLNGAGEVDSIIVTNPGTGYTSTPLVELYQRDRGNIDISSYVTLGDNAAYTGGLTKTGSGTLTLTAANTFTGPTVISDGTLQLGDGANDGTLASASIVNNANLVFNNVNPRVYSGTISGTGTLTKQGAGTQTLSGTCAFGNGVQYQYGWGVSGGTLAITGNVTVADGNNGGVGSAGNLDVTGTFTSGGHDQVISGTATLSGAGRWNLRGSGIFAVANGNDVATLNIRDSATLDINRDVGAQGAWTIGSLVIGMGWGPCTGTVNQDGGTVNLPYFQSWWYGNGPGLVMGGVVASWGSHDAVSSTYHLNGGTLNVSGVFNVYEDYNSGDPRLLPPSAANCTAIFNFNGGTLRATQSDSTDPAIVYEGLAHLMGNLSHAYVQAGGAKIDSNTFNVSINQALEHDPALGITPDGGLTKKGAGRLTLLLGGTYTGDTIVEAGTLGIGNAYLWDTADVRIASDAFLDLDFFTTDTIRSLYLGDAEQVAGLWGAVGNSNATYQSARITGDGLLNVVEGVSGADIPEPATMALLGLAVAGIGGYLRRRRTA